MAKAEGIDYKGFLVNNELRQTVTNAPILIGNFIRDALDFNSEKFASHAKTVISRLESILEHTNIYGLSGLEQSLIKKLIEIYSYNDKPSLPKYSDTDPNSKYRTGWFTTLVLTLDLCQKVGFTSKELDEMILEAREFWSTKQFTQSFKSRVQVERAKKILVSLMENIITVLNSRKNLG